MIVFGVVQVQVPVQVPVKVPVQVPRLEREVGPTPNGS